jgi:hypothetical protein
VHSVQELADLARMRLAQLQQGGQGAQPGYPGQPQPGAMPGYMQQPSPQAPGDFYSGNASGYDDSYPGNSYPGNSNTGNSYGGGTPFGGGGTPFAGGGTPFGDDIAGAAAQFIAGAIGRRMRRAYEQRAAPAVAANAQQTLQNQIAVAERHPDLRACLTDRVIFLAGGSRVEPMAGVINNLTVEQSDELVARLRG